jgi:hypothetical protein
MIVTLWNRLPRNMTQVFKSNLDKLSLLRSKFATHGWLSATARRFAWVIRTRATSIVRRRRRGAPIRVGQTG